MTVQNKLQARSATVGGVIAGAAGGLMLTILMAILNATAGRDVIRGLKFPGVWLLGQRALQPGFDFIAVYVGLGTHFAVSIAWGVAFALLVYGLNRALTVACGALWGLVVWAVMMFGVLPLLGFAGAPRSMPLGVSIAEHVLFGLTLAAAFLPFQRELPRPYFRRGAAHPV